MNKFLCITMLIVFLCGSLYAKGKSGYGWMDKGRIKKEKQIKGLSASLFHHSDI